VIAVAQYHVDKNSTFPSSSFIIKNNRSLAKILTGLLVRCKIVKRRPYHIRNRINSTSQITVLFTLNMGVEIGLHALIFLFPSLSPLATHEVQNSALHHRE